MTSDSLKLRPTHTVGRYMQLKNLGYIIIVLPAFTFLSGCGDSPVKSNNEFKITESPKQKIRWFTIEDIEYIKHYWARNYISQPSEGTRYFKSIKEKKFSKSFRLINEKIFDQYDKLILEVETINKRIDLKKELELQKIIDKNSVSEYRLDTLPSKYLKLRNEAILDSLLYTTPKGYYICGTAQNEILETDFPNSNTNTLNEIEGERLFNVLKKEE